MIGKICYSVATILTFSQLVLVIHTEKSNSLNLNFFLPLVLFIFWAFYTSILFSKRFKTTALVRALIVFIFSAVLLLLLFTVALVIVYLNS